MPAVNEQPFLAFPLLDTERVILRQVGQEDLDLVYAFNADARALRYVVRDLYTSLDQAREKVEGFREGYRNREGLWWTFVNRATGCAMGYGGLFELDHDTGTAEIGYGLLPAFWGQGYMTEIVAELIRFGWEDLQLAGLRAQIVPGNTASEKVLLRHGFERQEVVPDHGQARGQSFPMGLYLCPRP